MKENNYSSLFARCVRHLKAKQWLHHGAMVVLLLVVGAMTSPAWAKRFEQDQVWMELDWKAELSAFQVKVHAVDWDGANAGMENLHLNFYNADNDKWYEIAQVYGDTDDDGYVTIYRKNSGLGHRIWTSSQEVTDSRRYGGIDRTFYIYMPQNLMFQNAKIHARWDINIEGKKDHHGGWFEPWTGRTDLIDFKTQISNLTLSDTQDKLWMDYETHNLNAHEYTRASIYLDYSRNGRDWKIWGSGDHQVHESFNKTFTGWTKGPNNIAMTRQEFANGVYLRLITDVHPRYGESHWHGAGYSDVKHTGSTAVMKSDKLGVVQDSRNITLSWETLKPTQETSSQHMGNFEVQRLVGGEWQVIDEVDFSSSKTSYTYIYQLSDDECNKGNVEYEFRVWKKKFANANTYREYMTASCPATVIKTDYDQLEVTSVVQVKGTTSAVVNWRRVGSGVWDKDATVKLSYNENSQTVSYDQTKATIEGLAGCTTYSVKMERTALGNVYNSKPFTFVMPNTSARVIRNLQVSKGYFNNAVELSWEVPADSSDFKYFDIVRTPLLGGEAVSLSQIQHLNLTRYSYRDNQMDAGVLYTYSINGYSECNTVISLGDSKSSTGFSQPYAVVSGRVAYKGSQGVEGVTISAIGGDEVSTNKSLLFQGGNSNVALPAKLADFNDKDQLTFQTWIKPNTSDAELFIFSKGSTYDLKIGRNHDGSAYLTLYLLGQFIRNVATIPFDTWSHLSWTLDLSDDKTSAATKLYVNGELVDSRDFINLSLEQLDSHRDEKLMMGTNSEKKDGFAGNLEDIRFWNKVLTAEEIAFNYNAFLSGKEHGLAAYYRCDEKGSTTELFDYSAVGSVFNKNDGEMENTMLVQFSNNVPSANQLSVKTKTDIDGNYLINTLPYTSEGVQYSIVPSLGIHEFNPNKRTAYASPLSTIFNGVDFEDVSSFPVRGTVYYEGTNVPVAGANLYVDGIICSKDGSLIATAEDGTFEIEVPIGDHYIQVRKDGHVFKDNGRYPTDPNDVGTKFTFEKEMSNLTFYDETLVPVVGRVVGGQIESEKSVGFGESVNNIGVAQITLSSGTYSLNTIVEQKNGVASNEDNPNNVEVVSSSADIRSQSYRKGGNNEEVRYIYINTDSLTGEFSAMLPPLAYTIKEVRINSNTNITFSGLPTIDATDAKKILKDSLTTEEGVTKRFEYAALTKLTYTSEPKLIVTDKGNKVGAFGSKEAYVQTLGVTDTVQLYNIENDSVKYAFVNPIFVQDQTYQFSIVGYEDYFNYDDAANTVEYRMPMSGTVVTISNEMSSEQSVYVEDGTVEGNAVKAGEFVELNDNSLTLDSTGCAVYQWKAGFPNITAPYSLGLNIKYNANSQDYEWSENGKFRGVVFGELPSGNNFVTSGPDKIMMILRDPAGSGSAAFWETGTTKTTTETYTGSFLNSNEAETVTKFGINERIIVGTPATGTITGLDSSNDLVVGVNMSTSHSGGNEVTNTITTTKRISTSDSPDYVGADGDVFVGTATNLLFGAARNVGPKKEGNVYKLNLREVITMGSEFGTAFSYTQNYIENILIPNFYKNRNALLTQAESQDFIDNFKNTTEDNVYLTLLSESDANYGEAGTYKMVVPAALKADSCYSDKVAWNTQQAQAWISQLEQNEKVKVTAINKRDKYLKENYSFDQGTLIESSETTDSAYTSIYSGTWSMEAVLGTNLGFDVKGTGVDATLRTNNGTQSEWSDATTNQETTTTGFTLADDGFNDALTVDVLDAPDGFGSIFVTRGGQTSCPYEDAAVTKYYKPGTEISAATMQIEIPKAEMMNSFATDVPSGGTATYDIQLRNDSETGDDIWFDLKVLDASNPLGAKITMDGSGLTEEGRGILVPAGGNLKKTIQLTQTRLDVLEYKDIAIALVSQCQGDPTGVFPAIADTVYLSAQFVPSSSPITLEIEERTMNMFTSDTLNIVMKDIDRSFDNFESVYLQYKKVGDVDWTLGREWTLDENKVTAKIALLPSGGRIMVQFPMSDKALFPDGKYEFRLQTKSTFGTEGVTEESEVIAIVKDMVRPQALKTPSPTDGILSAGEDVLILFNEDIRSGELTAANNFIVSGVKNDARVAHDVALRLDGVTCAAQTEADIHLANTSFAIDLWLNYSTAGTILEQGAAGNKFIAKIIDAGKLSITLGETTVVSETSIPANKWCFITMSYDAERQTITALVADDATDTKLLEDVNIGKYTGVGPMHIGASIEGAIHEITLWNKARSVAEAKMEMYQSKAASTPNLIGYWKLDEGNGTLGRDLARSRHLTLSDATWALNNENKAATLASNAHIDLSIATVTADDNDSYALELWFRGAAQSNATLWSVGNDKLALGFDANGKLTFTYGGTAQKATDTDYLDQSWHHVALNVLRNGSTILYVDGKNVLQVASENVPALQDAFLTIGANRIYEGGANYSYTNNFVGSVDEIRYWNARITGEYIETNRFCRLAPDAASGLVAYYPFEESTLDGANQVVTSFTLKDLSNTACGLATAVATTGSDQAPGLKAAPALTNIQYSTVASEREIVFTIEESPYLIEGTTINFTVRNVRDVNNNLSQPITWSAYVNRNRLLWAEDAVTIEQDNGTSSSFIMSISNQSGTAESWNIFNLPAWLTASQTEGRLTALQSNEINFTISSALPLGNYEEVIYLSGQDDIYVPLVVNVTVLAEQPDWTVDPSYQETSMAIVGQLQFEGTPTTNAHDLLAAFVGDDCVGVASPIYQKRFDSYYICMNVYGNSNTISHNVHFKAWSATSGIIYPMVVTSSELTYIPNGIVGNFSTPFIWNAEDKIEQSTPVHKGWNWLSLYVQPDNLSIAHTMSSLTDNASLVKSKDQVSYVNANTWQGPLTSIEVGKMYKVSMNQADKLNVIGETLDQSAQSITVQPQWNWIGYTAPFNLPVADALAELEPQDGDMIKSKTAFAMYVGYEWIGILNTLQAGEGYMYMSNATTTKEFSYPSTAPMNAPMRTSASSNESSFEPIDNSIYPGNMTMTICIKDNENAVAYADVAVYAGDECRTAQIADENGIAYLTIPGETHGAKLTFKVKVDNEIINVDTDLVYADDANYGLPTSPYEVNIGNETALDAVNTYNVHLYPTPTSDVLHIDSERSIATVRVWNAAGQTIFQRNHTINKINVASWTSGIYSIQITDQDGKTWTSHFIKK